MRRSSIFTKATDARLTRVGGLNQLRELCLENAHIAEALLWLSDRGLGGGPREPHPPHTATARTGARGPMALGELGEGLGHCKRLAVNSGQHRPPIGGCVHQRWGIALCERLQGGLADSTASKRFTGTHMKGPTTKPARSLICTARELHNGRVRRGFHRRFDCGRR